MAGYLLVSSSLVFLVAAVAVAVAFFAGQVHGEDICAKADYVPLCRSVVKGNSDPRAAIKLTVEKLLFETKRAKQASMKLGNSQSLSACNENYDSAINDLNKSLEYLKSNDLHSLKTVLSGAITFYVTCDDAVAEGGIVQLASSLITIDTMMTHMASNCLHMSSLLT